MSKLKKIILIIAFLIMTIFSTNGYALTPASQITYEGIDVSNWQGYIDYAQVKNSGIDIVYIKSSEGSNYKDPYFEINYRNSKENGLKVGVYHYLTARSITEAQIEARFFASIISGKQIDCKLAMDFESFGDLTINEINQISRTFLEEVEELTGKQTIVYSDLFNSQNTFRLADEYPLWIAYYGPYEELENVQSNWNTWEGQQYTDMSRINGIFTDVDRDRFTSDVLLENTEKIPETENATPTNQTEEIKYIVKRGDTLWDLSRKYNVTVQEIVNLNNIQNPNLIFPGEELTIITNTNFSQVSGLGKDFYTVEPGDTLSELAIKFDTTVSEIVRLNNIQNPNLIFVGQRLRI